DAAAFAYPLDTGALEAGFHVDRNIVLGVRSGRVIDRDRRRGGSFRQHDLPQRHAQIGRRLRHSIDLARSSDWPGGDLWGGNIAIMDVHRRIPLAAAYIPGVWVEGNGPSLRRHDPDQVQRVSAAPHPAGRALTVSQLPVRSSPRNAANV